MYAVGREPEERWEMRTDKDEWKGLSEQYFLECEHISLRVRGKQTNRQNSLVQNP